MSRRYERHNGFYDYVDIEARFDSTGTCGHAIRKGDRIGWYPSMKQTQCASCWSRWCAENAEAAMLESGCY